jgi:SAM-dependent methyltransferase
VPVIRRIRNLLRYGHGPEARERKRADKRAAKRQRFESGRWEHGGELSRRRYASYEDYLEHQASKLDGIEGRLRENQEAELVEFTERFRSCPALARARTVLCLGARLGTEVRALLDLGHFAVGIDLNPGPANPLVLPGDFHQLVFPDGSVDAVYSNALDHVFDLERMVGEVSRVLAPGGVFVAEIEAGYGEGHVPGDFEAMHWRDSDALIARIAETGKLAIEEVRELGATRRGRRRLISFRKPA